MDRNVVTRTIYLM